MSIAVPLRKTAAGRRPENLDDHVELVARNLLAARGLPMLDYICLKQQRRPMRSSTAAPVAHGTRETENVNLDDVDFGRQVARHFETDFLLAHGRLGPDLHDSFLHNAKLRFQLRRPRRGPTHWCRHFFCAAPICGLNVQSQVQPALALINHVSGGTGKSSAFTTACDGQSSSHAAASRG